MDPISIRIDMIGWTEGTSVFGDALWVGDNSAVCFGEKSYKDFIKSLALANAIGASY